jgi:hypothetical protein
MLLFLFVFSLNRAIPEAFDINTLNDSVIDDGNRLMNMFMKRNERSRRLFEDSGRNEPKVNTEKHWRWLEKSNQVFFVLA